MRAFGAGSVLPACSIGCCEERFRYLCELTIMVIVLSGCYAVDHILESPVLLA